MSMSVTGEQKVQDIIDAARGPIKCRIPQRLAPVRGRAPATSISSSKARASNNLEPSKQKYEVITTPDTRLGAKNTRPRSNEHYSRPKSANRAKEETFSVRPTYTPMRSARPNERSPIVPKRPQQLLKKLLPDNHTPPNKAVRPFIMVPTTQRPAVKAPHTKNQAFLPDQATITKHEDLELRRSELSDNVPAYNDHFEGESITSRSDKVMQLKISWQEKMVQFDKMKNDLRDRQNGILALYAVMRDTHQEMSSFGEKVNLPAAEDLKIMNVAKMTPEQLLQLCAEDDPNNMRGKQLCDGKIPLTIDMNKLYDMPSKLVDTCEQTLTKRKEIIDWFETLLSKQKGISAHELTKKINEFNAENDMLKCSLEQVKSEFHKELEDIVNCMRKAVKETMALHLRTEELTYELSELNSQNADLKKQIHNADHLRSHANKSRLEELEKELKEEKCKRIFLRDRLSRTEGQLKINVDRASQLEGALEQARSQTWSLERTVQQLHEQNQKLQDDFDKELNKLTESIKEHTVHLEEIAEAREKLQTEKEDLEKKLTELSLYYNESLNNVKHEMNLNVAKLIETEKKYEQELEDKTRLESKLEPLCAQLLEAELRLKDTSKLLHEKEAQLDNAIEAQKELEVTKRELEKAKIEMDNNRDQITKQREAFDEIERSLKETVNLEKVLKSELSTKEEYINELENKQSLLEQQLQENENKMESYVEQLSALKVNINQLQEDFGEFENLNELHEMVNQQRAKLLEATRQNGELAEALQKKDEELERFNASLLEHEQLLLEREGIIKILSEKEEEQTNIIKILRNNLELRSQADNELDQQLLDKNSEIDSLIVNIETRKQQISNLEKIILTLEDQTRKASVQRKKDQEHIMALQNKIAEFEAFHIEATRNIETPAENLDSLIKILEDELGTSVKHEIRSKDHGQPVTKKKFVGDQLHERDEYHEDDNSSTRYHSEPDAFPTKIVMKNFAKKVYLPNEEQQYMGDNLNRKKAKTNIDTQKWFSAPDPLNAYASPPSPPSTKDTNFQRLLSPGRQKPPSYTRNLQYLNPDKLRDDKQYKMFKWAGHRI